MQASRMIQGTKHIVSNLKFTKYYRNKNKLLKIDLIDLRVIYTFHMHMSERTIGTSDYIGEKRDKRLKRSKRCIKQPSGKVCTSCELTSSTSGQLPFCSTTARIYLHSTELVNHYFWVSFTRKHKFHDS